MLAFPELEKDMTVLRLQDGWKRRLARDRQKSRMGNKTLRREPQRPGEDKRSQKHPRNQMPKFRITSVFWGYTY